MCGRILSWTLSISSLCQASRAQTRFGDDTVERGSDKYQNVWKGTRWDPASYFAKFTKASRFGGVEHDALDCSLDPSRSWWRSLQTSCMSDGVQTRGKSYIPSALPQG